jgi:hypothetical protein
VAAEAGVYVAALTPGEIAVARADVEAELTDTVNVWRDTGTFTFDDDTLVQLPVFDAVAENVAALIVAQLRTAAAQVVQGDETQFTRLYTITVPVDVEPQVGDIVEVIACEDQRTLGTFLTIRDVRGGSLSLSRRLQCQDNLTRPTFVVGD